MILAVGTLCAMVSIAQAATIELLGYEPSTQMLYWVDRADSLPPGAGVLMRRSIDAQAFDRGEGICPLGAGGPLVVPDSIRTRLRLLSPVFPAPSMHLMLQTEPGEADSIRVNGRSVSRARMHVELLDVDRAGHTGIEAVGDARVGVSGLYRITDDDREVAILSYSGWRDGAPRTIELPVVLWVPSGTYIRPALPLPALLATSALGDSLATVFGRVTLADGEPFAYATVLALATKHGAATDERGLFRLTGLPPGPCQLKVLATGYEPQLVADTLKLGLNPALELKVGSPERVIAFAGDDLRQFSRCEPWFAIPQLQADRVLPRGQFLLDGTGPGGFADATVPRGHLRIDELDEGCAVRIAWEPTQAPREPMSTKWPTRLLVLDNWGRQLRELAVAPAGERWSGIWDGVDEQGARCRQGTYIVRASMGDASAELRCYRRVRLAGK